MGGCRMCGTGGGVECIVMLHTCDRETRNDAIYMCMFTFQQQVTMPTTSPHLHTLVHTLTLHAHMHTTHGTCAWIHITAGETTGGHTCYRCAPLLTCIYASLHSVCPSHATAQPSKCFTKRGSDITPLPMHQDNMHTCNTVEVLGAV